MYANETDLYTYLQNSNNTKHNGTKHNQNNTTFDITKCNNKT